jgi:hypothetical protein
MKSYSPDQIVFVFKGIPITAWAPDSFITVKRNERTIKMEVGAGGDVVRTFTLDKSGMVEFELVAASVQNDILSSIQVSDEVNHDGIGAMLLQDINGTTFAHGNEACLDGPADIVRGKAMPTAKWRLLVANIEMIAGGADA